MTPALLALLAMHWPVERLAAQPIGETTKQAIEADLLYREDVGNGWVRYGLTEAGRDALAASRASKAVAS
jgi:hypothetical protein